VGDTQPERECVCVCVCAGCLKQATTVKTRAGVSHSAALVKWRREVCVCVGGGGISSLAWGRCQFPPYTFFHKVMRVTT